MTEAEWNQGTDIGRLLAFVGSRASERKLILFGVACCRRVWHLMTDLRHRHVVEAAERLANGLVTAEAFEEAMEPVIELWANQPDGSIPDNWGPENYMTGATRHMGEGSGAQYAASFAARGLACLAGKEGDSAWQAARAAEQAAQCDLLRDLIGKPFLPFRFDAAWLSGSGAPAVEMARTIDQENRFDNLSPLADVLEQSGCHDSDVLEHCRGPGPHRRGCWVVDALLGHEPAMCPGMLTEADWRSSTDLRLLLHFLQGKGSQRKWRLFAVACCRRVAHLISDERIRRALAAAERYAEGVITDAELKVVSDEANEAWDEIKHEEYMAEADANFCTTPTYAKVTCRLHSASAVCQALSLIPSAEASEDEHSEAREQRGSSFWSAASVEDSVLAAYEDVWSESLRAEAEVAAESARVAEEQAQCELLRDVFGHFFGPLGEEGAWLPFWDPMQRSGGEHWCLLPTPRKTVLRPEWLSWNDKIVQRMAQQIYEEEAFDRLPILADALEEAGCTDRDLLAHLRGSTMHTRGCWALDILLDKK